MATRNILLDANAQHTTSEHPSYSGIYLLLSLLNLQYPNTAITINLNILHMCCYMVRYIKHCHVLL